MISAVLVLAIWSSMGVHGVAPVLHMEVHMFNW